jgi:tetratricopeptide (TPR) repeat protein
MKKGSGDKRQSVDASTLTSVQERARRIMQTVEEASASVELATAEGALARGKIFEISGLRGRAAEQYERAYQLDNSSTEILYRLTLALLKAGKVKEALDASLNLVDKDPKFSTQALCSEEVVSSLSLLGDALIVNDKEEDAVKVFEQALENDPKETYAAGRLAQILLYQGNSEAARPLLGLVEQSARFADVAFLLRLASGALSQTVTGVVRIQSLKDAIRVSSHAGRPLFVDGVQLTSELTNAPEWGAEFEDARGTSDLTRRRELAGAWAKIALDEHSSIASFANAINELLEMGAPPSLIEDAAKALLDEVQHAKLAFGLARSYSGSPLGPSPLNLSRQNRDRAFYERILTSTFIGGCIGEHLASLGSDAVKDSTLDPHMLETLDKITEDEKGHAELAWKIVKWMVTQQPFLAETLEALLGELEQTSLNDDMDERAFYGLLNRTEHKEMVRLVCRAARARVTEEILKPEALLLHQRATDTESLVM